MPVVLDLAISPARDLGGDGRPTIVVAESHDVDDPALSDGEGALLEERVKLIPPSLAALFSSTFVNFSCNLLPVTWPNHTNCLDKLFILLEAPYISLSFLLLHRHVNRF